MGAWSCQLFGAMDAPASVDNTALYLTATSTSTEGGDEAAATQAAKATPPKKAPSPAASKAAAKVEPQALEASQILANPFGVGKPAVVAEKPTPAPSLPPLNQALNDNKAGNPVPEKASSNDDTSPSQAANDDTAPANAPVVIPALPHYGSSDSKNAPSVPVPGLSNQAATAVPAPIANAIANVVISSTNAQGNIEVATTHVPGAIVTTTNAQGSQISTTIPVVSPALLDTAPNPAPIVINGHTLSTDSQSHYILAGQTLAANTPLVIGSGASSTPVVLQTSGIHPVLIIGSSTTTLTLPTATIATATTPPAITIGTQAITPNAQGQYIVNSQTLIPGGEIVVGGTTASGGTVAVGGTTVSLAAKPTQVVVGTSTEGLAPYIVGGFGTGPSNNGTAGTVPFLGVAGRRVGGRAMRWLSWVVVGIVGAVWMV